MYICFIYTKYHNSLVHNHSAFTSAYEAHTKGVLCMTVIIFFSTVVLTVSSP